MKRFLLSALALCAMAGSVSLFSAGCESAEANDIVISPTHAKVSVGQSVSLSASGWDNFRWSLSNGDIGVLSRTVGKSVVYTAISSTASVQRITATAIGSGAVNTFSPTSTNSTSSLVGYSASAVITHK